MNGNKEGVNHCKKERMAALKQIIATKQMSNQDELLRALKQYGFSPTQATLSRDLKQLRVIKTSGMDGKYAYALPPETTYRRTDTLTTENKAPAASEGFVSINFSGNVAVVRTRPGYAGSIAYNIDKANINTILGTVAGDDTILIVVREGISDTQVKQSLQPLIPGIAIEKKEE